MRHVVIPVNDEATYFVGYQAYRENNGHIISVPGSELEYVPVPPDDQLTRDVDAITSHVIGAAEAMRKVGGANRQMEDWEAEAYRLRAHFQLDKEEA